MLKTKTRLTEKKTWHIGIFKESCAYCLSASSLKERGLFTWRKTIQKPEQLLHVSVATWRSFEYNVNCAEFGTPGQSVEMIKASHFTSSDITIATPRLDRKYKTSERTSLFLTIASQCTPPPPPNYNSFLLLTNTLLNVQDKIGAQTHTKP